MNLFLETQPYLIAGPCSVESKEQLFETVRGFKQLGVSAIRGGIWKPRSRPGNFEGIGERGIQWLAEASEEEGIPVALEVATTHHVDVILKAGISMVWLGARTTVNPFMVQELCEALKGTELAVLVKNPVNPDLELWIGAIERVIRSGIKSVAAVHRGFSSVEKSLFRNPPNWDIPIELRRRMPELPLICDPSHISGRSDLIQSISQKAFDLNYHGLMIEVHREPGKALSDANQQLSPSEFRILLSKIESREESEDPIFNARLEELRDQIDDLDEEMLNHFLKRLELVEQIGDVKYENNLAIYQPDRWREILESRMSLADELGINPEYVRRWIHMVHKESIERQTSLFEEKRNRQDESAV